MNKTGMIKKSRQREAILANLRNRCDHPTADTIYTDLRAEYPNISLGTVYRNLSLLADCGIISRVTCESKVEHFDARTDSHYHFICKDCGCVLDLPLSFLTDINILANDSFSGQITGHATFFYGHCPNCLSDKSINER